MQVRELETSGRASEAARLIKEKERVAAKLKKMGACCAGFGWRKVPGGWVCAAGVCRMSDEQLEDN